MKLIGVLLILLGIVAFAVRGISYTKEHRVLDVGPVHANVTEHKTLPLSPILGALALVAGIVLVLGARNPRTS